MRVIAVGVKFSLSCSGIVTPAAITIHGICFNIYADPAIKYVGQTSFISSKYDTLRKSQAYASLFGITSDIL